MTPSRRLPARQAPWHFLYFLPLPHQQGSLRPIFSSSPLTTVAGLVPPLPAPLPPAAAAAAAAGAVAVAAAALPAAARASASAEGWSAAVPQSN